MNENQTLERKYSINDIIITAIESGIYYWANINEYKWEDDENFNITYAAASVVEYDDDGKILSSFEVNVEFMEAALKFIRENAAKIEVNPDILKEILAYDASNGKYGEMDAEAADVIVQFGAFKEIRYG